MAPILYHTADTVKVSGEEQRYSPNAVWGIVKSDNLEIERFLHFKPEIRNLKLDNRGETKEFPAPLPEPLAIPA